MGQLAFGHFEKEEAVEFFGFYNFISWNEVFFDFEGVLGVHGLFFAFGESGKLSAVEIDFIDEGGTSLHGWKSNNNAINRIYILMDI